VWGTLFALYCLHLQLFLRYNNLGGVFMTAKTKTANVNVRLYPDVKAEAENIFAYHGLTLPEAITVFINHARHVGGFPFDLRGARWQDVESLAALEESKQMETNPSAYKGYHNVSDLLADCLEGDIDD